MLSTSNSSSFRFSQSFSSHCFFPSASLKLLFSDPHVLTCGQFSQLSWKRSSMWHGWLVPPLGFQAPASSWFSLYFTAFLPRSASSLWFLLVGHLGGTVFDPYLCLHSHVWKSNTAVTLLTHPKFTCHLDFYPELFLSNSLLDMFTWMLCKHLKLSMSKLNFISSIPLTSSTHSLSPQLMTLPSFPLIQAKFL